MILTVFLFSVNVVIAQNAVSRDKTVSTENGSVKTLKEIDEMIADTDYTIALIELSNYLAEHPDELDFVQKRIDKIMKARQQYLVLANQLIDVMEKEPENAQKKLEIIAKLETVEKNPTEEQLSFIRQAKIAAQFTYYRAQFKKIVDSSVQAADKGEYYQAVSGIQKGFDMYRQEFYEEYPKNVTDNVTQIVNRINSLCREYSHMQDRLRNSYNALINAIRQANYREANNAYNNFYNEMNALAKLRNNVYSEANSLRDIFNRLQRRDPELTEASYLPFIFRFTLGLDSTEKSGIIGAMDAQFKDYIEGVKPEVYAIINNSKVITIDSSNIATIRQNEFPVNTLTNITNFSNLGINVNSMYNLVNFDKKYDFTYPEYVKSLEYARTIVSALNQSYELVRKYQSVNEILKTISKPENPVDGIRSKDSYANQMIACSKEYDSCAESAKKLLQAQWYTEYAKEAKASDKVLEYSILDNHYSTVNTTIYDVCMNASSLQWKQTASYFASAASDICNYYQDEYKKADDLLSRHYPKEASELIAKTDKELASDAATLILCRDTLLQSISSSADKSTFAQEQKNVVDSVNRMNAFKTASTQTNAKCKQEILLSQRALNEAELRYDQAVAAFRRNDYTAARKNIELSSLKYKESFDHQEADSIRQEADRKLLSLGQQINDAENKLVVAEVRQLKTKAKSEYYNGNFEKAESLLAQAKSRWAVTNGAEEDEEIKNLQALVETALSMKTGRVIPPTAPLYPEMSQMLSIAHQYFDSGSAKIKKGQKAEGVELLEQAKKKLQEVQLVYPLNQEASLLTLRIDQLIDPDSFNQMFVQKVNAAKENYKVAARAQQAYADLLDLYQINPNYPGLKKLIGQVEIDLGLAQKPVDNTSLVKSQALYREALALFNSAGSDQAKLRNVLTKLDEAISLNGNNDQAILLKDRVQISLGGRASVVLSSADEAKYQQAIKELQKNNIVGAYAIVEQLLQTPNNRRSAKVLDLQKKVKALL